MKKIFAFLMIFLNIAVYGEAKSMEQSNLSEKEKNIAAIGALTSKGDLAELHKALNKALDDKMTINEINEILIQSYAYCGFPRSLNAISTFINVTKERAAKGKKDDQGVKPKILESSKDKGKIGDDKRTQLAGAKTKASWQAFAPGIEQYLKEHLFGDIFYRGVLSDRERELATVSFLSVLKGVDAQLQAHINMAKNTGLTQSQIDEALLIARTAAGKNDGVFPLGEENKAYAKYFIGKSYLHRLTDEGVSAASVTFEPACRNNWHIHHKGGQILLVTSGNGWYQEWGKPARRLKAGDTVNIPAETKHWHGAARDSWFSHIAIAVPAEGASNEWLEPVSDEEYNKLK